MRSKRYSPLILMFSAVLLAVTLLPACQPKLTQEPAILDVRPARLQRGETMIIEGSPYRALGPVGETLPGAPAFRVKVAETVVLLEGKFVDANGHEGIRHIAVTGVPIPSQVNPEFAERILVTMTSSLRAQIGYAKFEGKLGVRQRAEGEKAVTYWTGDVPGAPLRLTFFPPNMRGVAQLVVEYLVDNRVQKWMGLELEPVDAGLKIVSLNEGTSLAADQGLKVGDVLVKAGDRNLNSAAGLTIGVRQSSRRAGLNLTYIREGKDATARIPTASKPFTVPATVVYLGVMLIFALVCLALSMVIAGLLTWVERRVAARMQFRIGPNRVGPQGIIQWMADGIKLVLKEDVIPDAVDKPLFKLAPYLVFMGLLGTFVVLPFGNMLIVADLNVGLLYLMAITGFVALGLMMAGWSSNNKWALIGGMRSSAQIISYEIPTGLSLMVPVVLAGTLSTHQLVEQQGGFPWQWYVFDNPLIFICFFIYFISALAEGNRTPFDLPEAESELVSGYNIEYSGWRFAVFFLSEWANIFVIGAVATTVFLGGWQIPGVSLAAHGQHWYWQVIGLGLFFAKSMALVFVIIWIRWTLPRFRVDQMMDLCWKYFVPWSIASIVFCALWLWLAPPMLRTVVQFATFGICGLGLTYVFFARVAFNWQQNPEKNFSWNPFLGKR
jgi:NADH-quinone oxidoreductase subunit H